MFKSLNSPFKGFYPNVNPFGISPRYDRFNLPMQFEEDDEITHTISKVKNKKDANAEIERGEVVRQVTPEGRTTLHKAIGKRHSQGGVPVYLQDNSFIFSDYKGLNLNKNDLELHNLKGYSKNSKNNTPAKILTKNVDLKHYNEMERALEESRDPVQLKTAQLMKAKYDKAISNIAALQEAKKGEEPASFAFLTQDTPEKRTNDIIGEMYNSYELGGFYKFDKTASRLNPEDVFIPGNINYTNSGHQSRNQYGAFGDVTGVNDYTQKWFKRVSGRPFSPTDVASLQKLYDQYHKVKWGEGYDSGIGEVSDGNAGNRTNAYYYSKEKLKGAKNGEIDLNEYFDLPQEQQATLLAEYGLTPEDIEPYRRSVASALIISPDGQPVAGAKDEATVKDPLLDDNYIDMSKFRLPVNAKPPLPDYSWLPIKMSMLGNLAQYPRAYNPALFLEQPARIREQLIDAQPGVNDLLANRYASLKAANQYVPYAQAANQMLDANTAKQIMDYRGKVEQTNQGISTDVHNKNAIEQMRVVNANNERRAQYLDKMNELYQNLDNERNAIRTTNLNLIGKGLNEERDFNLQKEQYNWLVREQAKADSSQESILTQIKAIENSSLSEITKRLYIAALTKRLGATLSSNNKN